MPRPSSPHAVAPKVPLAPVAAGRLTGPALRTYLPHLRSVEAVERRSAQAARRSSAVDLLPVEKRRSRPARPRYARARVLRSRHLQGAADTVARCRSGRRMGAQTQHCSAVRGQAGVAPHAFRQRRRSLRRSAVPRRVARRLSTHGRIVADAAARNGARAIGWCRAVFRRSACSIGSRGPRICRRCSNLEAMTNDRVRDETGQISLVPPEERISGPGTTPIMAAFTHLNPEGSRFSDGSFGVYYCAQELDTALAEVRYHQARFLRRTAEGSMQAANAAVSGRYRRPTGGRAQDGRVPSARRLCAEPKRGG